MADSIKLLSFWSSPFAFRVKLALQLKGLDYEVEEEDLFNHKSDLLLRLNPVFAKVPVLIHNDKPVSESMNIVEYIDEVWPEDDKLNRPGFLPRDPFARATARFWADFVEKKFYTLGAPVYRAVASTGAEQTAGNEEFIQDWMRLEEALAKSEEGGPFFGGNKIGYVDIALSYLPWWNPALAELGVVTPDAEQCPRLHKWMEAMKNTPHAAAVFPPQELLTEYIVGVVSNMRKNVSKK